MPELNDARARDVLRQLIQDTKAVQRRLDGLMVRGGRPVQIDRAHRFHVTGPMDGQLLVEHETEQTLVYANATWRPTAGDVQMQMKVYGDTEALAVERAMTICVSDDLMDWRLIAAHMYVITPSAAAEISVEVENSRTGVMATLFLAAGEMTTYAAIAPPDVDTSPAVATVFTGDLLSMDVLAIDAAARGLGMILTFRCYPPPSVVLPYNVYTL
jgi:hypothetical protein